MGVQATEMLPLPICLLQHIRPLKNYKCCKNYFDKNQSQPQKAYKKDYLAKH